MGPREAKRLVASLVQAMLDRREMLPYLRTKILEGTMRNWETLSDEEIDRIFDEATKAGQIRDDNINLHSLSSAI